MKIKYLDDNTFDIYIKKYLIENINFKDKEEVKRYLKKLFILLEEKYELNIEGYYDVIIYVDKYYGVVVHFNNIEFEYYNYFKNQVDMKLEIKYTNFLYLVDNIENKNKFDIKIINNNIYLKIKRKLNNVDMMKLLENSEIIYNM